MHRHRSHSHTARQLDASVINGPVRPFQDGVSVVKAAVRNTGFRLDITLDRYITQIDEKDPPIFDMYHRGFFWRSREIDSWRDYRITMFMYAQNGADAPDEWFWVYKGGMLFLDYATPILPQNGPLPYPV